MSLLMALRVWRAHTTAAGRRRRNRPFGPDRPGPGSRSTRADLLSGPKRA